MSRGEETGEAGSVQWRRGKREQVKQGVVQEMNWNSRGKTKYVNQGRKKLVTIEAIFQMDRCPQNPKVTKKIKNKKNNN